MGLFLSPDVGQLPSSGEKSVLGVSTTSRWGHRETLQYELNFWASSWSLQALNFTQNLSQNSFSNSLT